LNVDRTQRALIAGIAATCAVSIFAAQTLLVLAVIVFAARLAMGRASWPRLPLDGPILAYSVWTLLSASFSPDPVLSHESSKKLVLFVLLYLAVDTLTEEASRERVVDAALLGGLVLGTGALVQYYFLGFDTLNSRPTSFMGHYMTAAGLAMGTLVLAAARLALTRQPAARPSRHDVAGLSALLIGIAALSALQAAGLFAVEGERLFVAGLVAAAAFLALTRGAWHGPATGTTLAIAAFVVSSWALILSRTRNAWLGAIAGLALVAVLRAPRALWLLGAGVAAIAVVRPVTIIDRLTFTDASSVDRYYMWQAGIDMIRDKPVFGQGPGMILARYPSYRWPEAPNALTPHLHNSALQIAAERGLPCVAFWLWCVAAAMADAYREWRRGGSSGFWSAGAGLGVLAAIMVAGLFEHNFGDSEIFMFILLMVALPYAIRRERQGTIPAP
jgi:O-antigen ligase